MIEQLRLINLKCASCGVKLDVSSDLTRFACGYCGTEQIVERRGGTVSLKPITEAIEKVQVGTDKTAAELALARLNEELQSLLKEQKKQLNIAYKSGGHIGTFGVLLMFFGIPIGLGTLITDSAYGFQPHYFFKGIVILSIALGASIPLCRINSKLRREAESKVNKEFDPKIAQMRRQIAKNKAIVDS